MGNRMSSGKIQAKIRHEIRSVGLFYAGWMERGEKCKERHFILALVYTSIEGQKTCYSGQTLDVQWCCLLINLFSCKAQPVQGSAYTDIQYTTPLQNLTR